MSHHIPFEIQSEIMKKLPVKSLIQFRSVSKQWKSFIDCPEFINNYHINHTNPQHHLLVEYESDNLQTYTSIIDNNTFPQQKCPLNVPELLSLLRNTIILGSADGLLCFRGDIDEITKMAVIWNPSVRKSVGIVITRPMSGYIVVGFGVCPDTNDPKLVKVCFYIRNRTWVVEVFTLSSRVWKTVYKGARFKSCDSMWYHAFVNGVIYFHAYDDITLDPAFRSNFVISFDLKSEKFGEVCLPERLVHTRYLDVQKVNDSLGLLESYTEGEMKFCGVWSRKDGANKPFTKIYTIKVDGWVLGFRNDGEVVQEVVDDDNNKLSRIEVHDPFTGLVNGVGINGKRRSFSARSYMETLLLLDESDSIIINNDDGSILQGVEMSLCY